MGFFIIILNTFTSTFFFKLWTYFVLRNLENLSKVNTVNWTNAKKNYIN